MGTQSTWDSKMFSTLYGQTSAALYAKAAGQNAQARQLYNASADTYYKANDAAAYDDWVRARNHWDYFYNRLSATRVGTCSPPRSSRDGLGVLRGSVPRREVDGSLFLLPTEQRKLLKNVLQ